MRVERQQFLRAALGAAAPAQARADNRPNIVLIMVDDMGYSDIGPYGGEIETPNLDRLAANGLRFTQFYNNAKCAPTRASLLTGLYSQQVGCYGGPVPMRHCATLAEVLKSAGYRTYMTGKWHADELPTDRGFERYYGLADGCCNFFNPGERRPGEPEPAESRYPRKFARDGKVMRPYTPPKGWYSTDAFTDAALSYLDEDEDSDSPFFLYLAYTAPHFPLHALPEDIAKYRGKYLKGWDALREERRERMLHMGLIRAEWGMSERDERAPAWDDCEDMANWDPGRVKGIPRSDLTSRDMWDLKMAVYAAMVDRVDQNIGRLLAKLEAQGELDNTLIVFLSDNGGCAESRNITPEIGPGPVESYRTVDLPWANAQNTPLKKYKRHDYEGGINTPFIAHWPARIAQGTMTEDVGHIIDFMPTVLEMSGARYPSDMNGGDVLPYEGRSLLPIFDGLPVGGRPPLFWQFSGSRAARQGGWKIVAEGSGSWELYNMQTDRTERHNVAAEHPQIVTELAGQWEAWQERVRGRD